MSFVLFGEAFDDHSRRHRANTMSIDYSSAGPGVTLGPERGMVVLARDLRREGERFGVACTVVADWGRGRGWRSR